MPSGTTSLPMPSPGITATRKTRFEGMDLSCCCVCRAKLALLWQILRGAGFPNQFFGDSSVVGFWRADHGWHDIGLA